jgi:hypothetical protein
MKQDINRQQASDDGPADKPIVATDTSDIAALAKVVGFAGGSFTSPSGIQAVPDEPEWPWPEPVRQQALDQVAEDLIKQGILDPESLTVDPGFQKELSWENDSSLPTGGLIVKGCLDECDTCEPELAKLYELEVERKALENQLLQKQIDLLEKSQDYRCCPAEPAVPA